MLSKSILTIALLSIMVPIAVLGQTCTSNTGCTSGCCVINNQISNFFGVTTGTCAATAPTEAQSCSTNCPCGAGLICTDNILCRRCGKICMAQDVFNRLVAYYNAACTTTACVTASYGRTCNYRMGSQVGISTLQTSPTSRVFTLPYIE